MARITPLPPPCHSRNQPAAGEMRFLPEVSASLATSVPDHHTPASPTEFFCGSTPHAQLSRKSSVVLSEKHDLSPPRRGHGTPRRRFVRFALTSPAGTPLYHSSPRLSIPQPKARSEQPEQGCLYEPSNYRRRYTPGSIYDGQRLVRKPGGFTVTNGELHSSGFELLTPRGGGGFVSASRLVVSSLRDGARAGFHDCRWSGIRGARRANRVGMRGCGDAGSRGQCLGVEGLVAVVDLTTKGCARGRPCFPFPACLSVGLSVYLSLSLVSSGKPSMLPCASVFRTPPEKVPRVTIFRRPTTACVA